MAVKKKKKRRKKKYTGNNRAIMMLVKDGRRRWLQYGENRKIEFDKCVACDSRDNLQVDHIEPLGPRPMTFEELSVWLKKLFEKPCQILCRRCNYNKAHKG